MTPFLPEKYILAIEISDDFFLSFTTKMLFIQPHLQISLSQLFLYLTFYVWLLFLLDSSQQKQSSITAHFSSSLHIITFQSRSSRQVETLNKSFTHSCLCRFGMTFRHSIRAVGVPLNSSGLEEAL